MDGKGRCMDNVFVERLWRNVKYEEGVLEGLPESARRSGSHWGVPSSLQP